MATRHLTPNMGGLDRAARAFVVAPAAIVAAIALGASSTAGLLLFALAGIASATGAVGYCPLYVPFGIDTRRRTPGRTPTSIRRFEPSSRRR